MTTQLTYLEFKTKRINFNDSQPNYLQGLESSFEDATQFMYKMYLKGKVPMFAK